MALKETLDVIAAFGYVAGALTAASLAHKGWKVFRPSTIKEPFPPELRDEMERNRRNVDALKARTIALINEKNIPA